MNEKTLIVKSFLHVFLKKAFKKAKSPSWEKQDFKEENSLDKRIKKILKALANELWATLKAALNYVQE